MMEKNWIMTFQNQKYSQIFQKKISAERKHSVSSLMDEHAEKRMQAPNLQKQDRHFQQYDAIPIYYSEKIFFFAEISID